MLEKMKEIIAGQLNVNAEDVKPESRFKEDLNADSLDLFELVMALGRRIFRRNSVRRT